MTRRLSHQSQSGFTLVEMMIGLSLALAILTAVLSSYIFLGRSLSRLANQQTLESEGRRALAYFTQDVRMASNISGTPSNSSLSLTIPNGASTATVTYAYNSTTGVLTRTLSGNTRTLASYIQSSTFAFRYFDETGNPYDNGSSPYTTISSYAKGIKQVSMRFTTQTGNSGNGTLTPLHNVVLAQLLVRNRDLLQ